MYRDSKVKPFCFGIPWTYGLLFEPRSFQHHVSLPLFLDDTNFLVAMANLYFLLAKQKKEEPLQPYNI